MSATVLTKAAAAKANLPIIEGDKGRHAVHTVVVAMRAARRSGTACTKTKSEVNLTGAKPWRQKGTGRARAGYASSVVWTGGGVVHGPKPRDYSKTINKKMRKLAFTRALSDRIQDGDVLMVDGFSIASGKTKDFVTTVGGFADPDSKGRPEDRILIIAPSYDDKTLQAGRNVKPTLLASAREVNTEQLLQFKKIVITTDALPLLAERTVTPAEEEAETAAA